MVICDRSIGMKIEEIAEIKRKFALGIPFTEEERKFILGWKIKQTLIEAGGEMSVGDLYEKLGVKP